MQLYNLIINNINQFRNEEVLKMDIILFLTVFLVVTLLILYFVGRLIPREKTYSKSVVFNVPLEVVWNTITDIERQKNWRSEIREIQVIDDTLGNEQWIEYPKRGPSIKFKTIEKNACTTWSIETIDNSNFTGRWVGVFESMDSLKTKVTFTETPCIPNPYFRVFSYFFVDIDRTMNLYIENLLREIGEMNVEKQQK